jgi:hypothetical protein
MDSKRAIAWLLIMAAIAATSVAGAQARPMPGDSGNRVGFAVQTDLDFGGDNLATVSFKNGKSQDVKAGQGVTVSAGVHFRPVDTTPFDVQALVGYKYVTTAASNADITVTRVVLQLVGDYQFDNGVYLGGGVVQHSGTRLDGDGFFRNVDFDDATGFVLESGWRWVGLHYTNIKYRNNFVKNVDASHVGVRFMFRF